MSDTPKSIESIMATLREGLSAEAERRLRLIISQHRLSDEELAHRERAALRIRERFIVSPFYAEQDRKFGMDFWRLMQSSAVNLYPDA